jgi:hypothetical protein
MWQPLHKTANVSLLPLDHKKTDQDTAIPPAQKVRSIVKRALPQDRWLLATFLLACAASITSVIYFFVNNQILLMNDSYSHMLIARRVIDNVTPGVTQFGGIWLPLPHILMLPFIWNNYLWFTGLAGSFSTMPCYVISAVYLFLAARRLTHNSRASFIGTLVFILNPNILYLQTTPLSELVLIAGLTVASYYFLAWAQDGKTNSLVVSAASTFLATLSRYDAWPLFFLFLLLIVLIGWLKRQKWQKIEAHLIIFCILGGLGIALWFLWCQMIYGDLLYFQHSAFSSQAQQKSLPAQLAYLHTKILIDLYSPWQSLRAYTLDSLYNLGLLTFILAVLGVIVFFLRRITPEMLAAAAFLIPFPFYVFSLFMGQAVIFVPGAAPIHAPLNITFYNVRYGVEVVAPAALFTSFLASRGLSWLRILALNLRRTLFQCILVIVILLQTVFTIHGGIITLQDSLYGLDCASTHPVVVYLVQHYQGGRILEDLFTSKATSLESDVGLDFKNIIYEGSGSLWKQALHDPATVADWILVNPRVSNDFVAQSINVTQPRFLGQFTLVVQEDDGLLLFHRKNSSPLAEHPIPVGLLTNHRLCGIG